MRKATLARVSITPKEKIHHPRHSCARDWSSAFNPAGPLSFCLLLTPTSCPFFCCVVPACLVSPWPLWFRLELLPLSPRSCSWLLVCAVVWLVGALTCSSVQVAALVACPQGAPAWPLAVWGLASEAPERPSPSLPAHRTHLQLVLAFRVLLSCSQVLCFHVLPAR